MFEDYYPEPIDTKEVVLSDEMKRLIERLAYNQHELRAKEYIDAGWVFGDRRDISKHTHPNLMPYSELTEEQKEGDLRLVTAVVKSILALGYTISDRQDPA